MRSQSVHRLGGFLFLFCSLVAAAPPSIESVAPKQLPVGESGKVIGYEQPEAIASPDRNLVLVDALKGVVFIDEADKLEASGRSSAAGVVADGNLAISDLADFQQHFDTFLNQPLTLHLLDQITHAAVRYYRQHDYPIVDVLTPEGQDITDGVVQFVVLLGKRGDLRVEGAQYFSKEKLAENIRLQMNETITQTGLEEDIAWLNNNPFRRVDVLFERGKKFGETDVVLDVEDRFPLRLYGGVEDSGTELTGKQRWLSGFNWGNVFGLDHQLNYQFTSSFDSDELRAHSFSYVAPLSWRHTAILFGAYSKSDPDITGAGFDLYGKNYQLGFRYKVPLSKYKAMNHELVLGYDFKRSNNNLDFGGLNIFSTYTNISHFSVGYSASIKDQFGITSFSSTVNISPGNMIRDNGDAEFAQSRFRASADYIYSRLSFNRVTRLPMNFSWLADVQFQMSNKNLLGSEQFNIAGYNAVRGYDAYSAVGDKGLLIKNEVRTPAMTLFEKLSGEGASYNFKDELQFLWFLDYGSVRNVDLLVGEGGSDLMSTGVGLRYSIGSSITLRADYGWQLKELDINGERTSRLHIGFVFSY